MTLLHELSSLLWHKDSLIWCAVGGTGALILYIIGLGMYRLYLSPLSQFPGPKLAALTQWYEIYFEVVKGGGGQFTFEIQRMHKKYGPIVRINPTELHVDDPEYYDVLYATNKAYDKMDFWTYRFNMPLATFGAAESNIHKIRRSAIAPFFARNKIRDHNQYIQSVADRISHRLSTEYSGTTKVLDLVHMWGSMTSDVISELVFARPKHFVDYPNFRSDITVALSDMVFTAHIMTHFGFILSIMNSFPNWFIKLSVPSIKSVVEFREEMELQISDILEGRNNEAKNASHATLFHEMLSSNLPPEELRQDRLQNEAMSMIGAGVETTKWAMSVGCFHVLDNPSVEARLRVELEAAIPDPTVMLTWNELEKLPYLSAVVTESLRLAYGVVQRSPRINKYSTWQYGEYTIPPGVPVGMDAYHMHSNEKVFPDHNTFRPERWLNDPKGPDGVRPLSHYMVAFSKGSRMCIGLNMAYAEIYIGLATVFRRHHFQLFETDRSDVDFKVDMVSTQPKFGSKGVRVLVK